MWEDEKVEWTDLSSVRARSDSALTLTLLAFLHQRGRRAGFQLCAPQLKSHFPVFSIGKVRGEHAFKSRLSVEKVETTRASFVSRPGQHVSLGAVQSANQPINSALVSELAFRAAATSSCGELRMALRCAARTSRLT
eukprot:scaffold29745_cov76-Phaeocystis_antarctica.AAC.7